MLESAPLADAGNTIVVVEHDMRVLAQVDWIIDLGPGAGDDGGRIIASGTPDKVADVANSRTAKYLKPLVTQSRNGNKE